MHAQANTSRAPIDTTISQPKDTTGKTSPLVISQSTGAKTKMKGFQPTKNPSLALALSMAAPGAGQIYDESYWKLPIVWGLGGYWVYEFIQNGKSYRDYRDQYIDSQIHFPPDGDGRLLQLRNFYKDERDKFGWYLGVLYLANIIDAYVGAHLYDFDVTPNLGQNGFTQPGVTATIRYRF